MPVRKGGGVGDRRDSQFSKRKKKKESTTATTQSLVEKGRISLTCAGPRQVLFQGNLFKAGWKGKKENNSEERLNQGRQ